MNIAMFLQMAGEACGDRVAITSDGVSHTYAELYAAAQNAAITFAASNASYVSVLDTSSPAVPIALMGAAMAGIPYVPLNYRLARPQLDALIERIEPVYLVADAANQAAYSGREGCTVVDRHTFLTDATTGDGVLPDWPSDPEAIAVQLFTSGTTGTPKAAILRHENLVSYILSTVEFMGAGEEEATLVSVPPYHIAGISAVMSSIYGCRRIVQLADFAADEWVRLAATERVTNAFVVPTMLSRIIEHLDDLAGDADLSSLQALAYGGGKMPVPVIRRALEQFPDTSFTNAYGLTETSSTITLLDPDDHRTALQAGNPAALARLGSVGKPLPSVELEVRDEDGNVLGPNQPGEIFVRGPQVSGEYLERSALINDGWFPTRDAGYLDEEGYLFLSGRADDVIVRGGENISPAEIEDLLVAQQGVTDVAAVGIPSEEWGEAVALAIVADAKVWPSEKIVSLIRQELRSSRVPEVIEYRDELPYNETGKLLRRVVREWFA